MKKLIFMTTLFSTAFLLAQKTDNETIKKNSIRVNAFPLFVGFYEFQMEKVLNTTSSLKFGFGTGNFIDREGSKANKDFENAFGTNSFNNKNTHLVKGFSVNIDYRYFFSNVSAPKGLYVSPGIQYIKANDKYTYTNREDNSIVTLINEDFSVFNIRTMFGYQFIVAKTVVINPYLGPGLALGRTKSKNSSQFATGFSLNGGIDLGISF